MEEPAKNAGTAIPRLEIVDSPYRRIFQPILDFVDKILQDHPDRLVAVVIPELVEPHWYEYLLHNLYSARLRALLYVKRDERLVVVDTPWYLREK